MSLIFIHVRMRMSGVQSYTVEPGCQAVILLQSKN